MVVEITGLAWFSEDDYAQARELMSDEAELPEDYSRWLRGAETTERDLRDRLGVFAFEDERDLREQGLHPIRVAIVPEDFVRWCRKRGIAMDARARREFARFVLTESQ